MKYIKYLIIFFVIIIIILSCLLLLNILSTSGNIENNYTNNSIISGENNIGNIIENNVVNNIENNDGYLEEEEENEYDIDLEFDNKLSYVTNRADYFTISSLYESYINKIADKDNEWLQNTLSPNYIKNYSITENNIFNKLTVPAKENNNQYYKINITEMLNTQIDGTTYVFIVRGKCRIVGNDTIFSVPVMFEMDKLKKAFYIYPYQYINDNGINKLGNGDILKNHKKEDVEAKKDNTFNFVVKTDADVATEYFNNYAELIGYYQDDAYSNLNNEYSKKRFGSEENFKNYLKENSEVLSTMEIDKYKVYSTQNYTDYICTDKYDNLYIFRQQGGIMRYTTFLDNYTVLTDSYAKEYNQLEKFEKGKYNLNKFINMVNTKDYNAIYNVLDNTFRSNNFNNQLELEQFIKNNMYSLNRIEINDYNNETYEYYVFEVILQNMKNTEERKKMTVILNQTESTDFTISFSF